MNTHNAEDELDDELNPKTVSIIPPPFDSGAFADDHLDKHDVLDPTSMVVSALGMSRQSADACKSTPAITQISPRNLIPTQTRNEMSSSQIKRLTKSMEKNGFDQKQPVDVW